MLLKVSPQIGIKAIKNKSRTNTEKIVSVLIMMLPVIMKTTRKTAKIEDALEMIVS